MKRRLYQLHLVLAREVERHRLLAKIDSAEQFTNWLVGQGNGAVGRKLTSTLNSTRASNFKSSTRARFAGNPECDVRWSEPS
jgi:hypothetical protein